MNTRSCLASLILLGLVACKAPPMLQDRIERSPALLERRPNNVAILPVEDASEGALATKAGVLAAIRAEIGRLLIHERGYATVNPTYVDAHVRQKVEPGSSVVEAGYLRKVAAQAIAEKTTIEAFLGVRIRRWDQSTLLLDNRVSFDAQLVLYGTDPGEVLWSLDLWGQVVAGGGKAAPQDPAQRAKAAAKQFVKEAMGRLPRRLQS